MYTNRYALKHGIHYLTAAARSCSAAMFTKFMALNLLIVALFAPVGAFAAFDYRTLQREQGELFGFEDTSVMASAAFRDYAAWLEKEKLPRADDHDSVCDLRQMPIRMLREILLKRYRNLGRDT